jgi:hypothetical protein
MKAHNMTKKEAIQILKELMADVVNNGTATIGLGTPESQALRLVAFSTKK